MDEKNYDTLKLRNQVCFPLYAASRYIIKTYTPYLDELGLTYTQYIAMMVLWEEREITSKELGETLFLDSGTLTPLLKKLEEKGFLTRKRAPQDERNLLVTVTEKGMRLRERAVAVPQRMAKCVSLSPEEGAELYRLLYRILGEERYQ